MVKEWRDLEIGGRGLSRSLKMTPFDISYTTFSWWWWWWWLSIGRPL